MNAADVESLERATLSALSPEATEEIPGWLLPFDGGTVGRAKSAVPLSHDAPDAALVSQIEARYAAHGLPAVLRIPEVAAFGAFGEALTHRGFTGGRPTQVHCAAVSATPPHFGCPTFDRTPSRQRTAAAPCPVS